MEINLEYKQKYLKYKEKYINKKYFQKGGMQITFNQDGTAKTQPAESAAQLAAQPVATGVKPAKPAIPTKKPPTTKLAAKSAAQLAATKAKPAIPTTKRPLTSEATATATVAAAGVALSLIPFPVDQLKDYISKGENYLYYAGVPTNIPTLIESEPHLNKFNYAICINKGKIVIVNRRDNSQLNATWNMLKGLHKDSTSNPNIFGDMIHQSLPQIRRGIYESFNYPVTVFTIEEPETTFGIAGLYPLVAHFDKFLV